VALLDQAHRLLRIGRVEELVSVLPEGFRDTVGELRPLVEMEDEADHRASRPSAPGAGTLPRRGGRCSFGGLQGVDPLTDLLTGLLVLEREPVVAQADDVSCEIERLRVIRRPHVAANRLAEHRPHLFHLEPGAGVRDLG
jgi:hypothetical protein